MEKEEKEKSDKEKEENDKKVQQEKDKKAQEEKAALQAQIKAQQEEMEKFKKAQEEKALQAQKEKEDKEKSDKEKEEQAKKAQEEKEEQQKQKEEELKAQIEKLRQEQQAQKEKEQKEKEERERSDKEKEENDKKVQEEKDKKAQEEKEKADREKEELRKKLLAEEEAKRKAEEDKRKAERDKEAQKMKDAKTIADLQAQVEALMRKQKLIDQYKKLQAEAKKIGVKDIAELNGEEDERGIESLINKLKQQMLVRQQEIKKEQEEKQLEDIGTEILALRNKCLKAGFKSAEQLSDEKICSLSSVDNAKDLLLEFKTAISEEFGDNINTILGNKLLTISHNIKLNNGKTPEQFFKSIKDVDEQIEFVKGVLSFRDKNTTTTNLDNLATEIKEKKKNRNKPVMDMTLKMHYRKLMDEYNNKINIDSVSKNNGIKMNNYMGTSGKKKSKSMLFK